MGSFDCSVCGTSVHTSFELYPLPAPLTRKLEDTVAGMRQDSASYWGVPEDRVEVVIAADGKLIARLVDA